MANKIITIDAGHGLHTSGKQTASSLGTVYKEWSLNDKVVRKIMSALANYNGVEVHRIDDPTGATDIALATRVRKSNSLKADIHISIHQNAGGGTGTEVYWHTRGTAADKKLASIVAPKLASKTGLRNRGVKTAEFAVLTCNATAILCEGGFMDTANDYKVITSDKGQQAYADAVVEGLVEYLGLTKKANASTSNPSSGGSSTSSSTGTSFTVRIKVDSLNIRKSADFNSQVVGTVKKGEVYTIVEERNGLGRLKSGAGWISMGSDYVERTGTSTATSNEYKVRIVNCSALNVRKGAGVNYAVTATVKNGEVYTIIGETNGWLKHKSGVGYINSKYTQKI